MSKPRPPARARGMLVAFALLAVSACTTTTVVPEVATAPQRQYAAVAIGELKAADELAGARLPFLRRGLEAKLAASQAFRQVLTSVPPAPAPDTLVVSGSVTELDKGDRLMRMFIGFGAGRARTVGTFALSDGSGAELARFQTSKAYAGGAGIGGGDFIDMDELMQKLGEAAAESVVRWARGERLEASAD